MSRGGRSPADVWISPWSDAAGQRRSRAPGDASRPTATSAPGLQKPGAEAWTCQTPSPRSRTVPSGPASASTGGTGRAGPAVRSAWMWTRGGGRVGRAAGQSRSTRTGDAATVAPQTARPAARSAPRNRTAYYSPGRLTRGAPERAGVAVPGPTLLVEYDA